MSIEVTLQCEVKRCVVVHDFKRLLKLRSKCHWDGFITPKSSSSARCACECAAQRTLSAALELRLSRCRASSDTLPVLLAFMSKILSQKHPRDPPPQSTPKIKMTGFYLLDSIVKNVKARPVYWYTMTKQSG